MLFSMKGMGARTGMKPVAEDLPRKRSKQQQSEFQWPIIFQIFDFLPHARLWIIPRLSKFYQHLFIQQEHSPSIPSRQIPQLHPLAHSNTLTSTHSSVSSISPSQSRSTSLKTPLSFITWKDYCNKTFFSLLSYSSYCKIFDFIGFPGIYQLGISRYSKKFYTFVHFYMKTRTYILLWNVKESDIIKGLYLMPKLCTIVMQGICCRVTSGLVNALAMTPTLCPQLQKIDSMRLPNLSVKEMSQLYSGRPSLKLYVQEIAIEPQLMELGDILKSEAGYEQFVKFLRQQVEPDGAYFWRAVMEFQRLTFCDNVEDKAFQIWRQFLEVGSPFEIELGETTWNQTKRWIGLIRTGHLTIDGLKEPQLEEEQLVTPNLVARALLNEEDNSSPLNISQSGHSSVTGHSPTNHLRSLLAHTLKGTPGRISVSSTSHYVSLLRKQGKQGLGGSGNGNNEENNRDGTGGGRPSLTINNNGNKSRRPSRERELDPPRKSTYESHPSSTIVPSNLSSSIHPPSSRRKSSVTVPSTQISSTMNHSHEGGCGSRRNSAQEPPIRRRSSLIEPPTNHRRSSHVNNNPEPFPCPNLIQSSSQEKLLIDASPIPFSSSFDPLPVFFPTSGSHPSRSSTIAPSYQNTPLVDTAGEGELDESDNSKLKLPKVKVEGKYDVGIHRVHSVSSFKEVPVVATPAVGWEEIPPLLHIFDLAQDEVYVNLIAQDLPKFRYWDRNRDTRDGNMAKLLLRGESPVDRNSTSEKDGDQYQLPHSQKSSPPHSDIDSPPDKSCCCIIC